MPNLFLNILYELLFLSDNINFLRFFEIFKEYTLKPDKNLFSGKFICLVIFLRVYCVMQKYSYLKKNICFFQYCQRKRMSYVMHQIEHFMQIMTYEIDYYF